MKLTEIDTKNITDDIIKKILFSTPKKEFFDVDCLIIFGCHLKPLLDERLDTTISIIKNKNVNRILLTGGIGVNGDFNESEYMKKKLLNCGIGEGSIITEDKSTTTEENIINCIQILKENSLIENKNIVLVSSQAHLRR
ncbi:MAG: YdcF family protein, partial [Bacilli bacterium]